MAKPAVILVGADKGGVGKTTVARTLIDYFGAHQTPIRAFDTESPRGTLKRFHPELTEVVDVTAVPDQMKIFDTLGSADAKVTVIDVRAGLLVADLAGAERHRLSRVGQEGPDHFRGVSHPRTVDRFARGDRRDRARHVGDANYFLVKNFINNTTFFDWDPATYNSYFKRIKGAEEITIPKLNEMACEQVEVASVPFVSFVGNKGAKNEAGQLFIRSARLCPALAWQCLG